MPVVVMVLVKLGLLHYALMARTRRYAIAIAVVFIGATVMTPPDPFSQVVLALPMIVLYEICIWLAWFHERRKKSEEEPATA